MAQGISIGEGSCCTGITVLADWLIPWVAGSAVSVVRVAVDAVGAWITLRGIVRCAEGVDRAHLACTI